MSFVGKILVVLQVVLSICLMAFAGAVSATHDNWRKKVTTLEASVKSKSEEVTNLQAQMKKVEDDMRAQVAQREQEVGELRVKNLQITGDLDTLNDKYNSLAESEKSKKAIADIAIEDDKARQIETLRLRELYRTALAGKDEEFKKKVVLEDKSFEQAVLIEQLKRDHLAMMKENKTLKDALLAQGLPTEVEEHQRGKTPPPSVAGEVLNTVRPKQGGELVEISLGSDDGLLKGNELFVYRLGGANGGSKYLGKIRIEFTSPDRAVGAVMDKAKNGIIQAGDAVSTKL